MLSFQLSWLLRGLALPLILRSLFWLAGLKYFDRPRGYQEVHELEQELQGPS